MIDRDLRAFPGQFDRNRGLCNIVAAAISGAAALAGGAISASGASSAANSQKAAANNATAEQQAQYQQTRADLLPYNTAGQNATNALDYGLGIGTNDASYSTGGDTYGSLAAPVTMTEAQLQQTPGYQFNLSQGLKATQNAAAARGLGVSGAALKGAGSYATGLADSTYQNQFNNAVTNQTNTYNRLMGIQSTGENAAAQTGAYGTQTAANIGQTIVGAGNAAAAGQVGAANAYSGALNGVTNAYTANALLGGGGLYGSGGSGGVGWNGTASTPPL